MKERIFSNLKPKFIQNLYVFFKRLKHKKVIQNGYLHYPSGSIEKGQSTPNQYF